MSINSILSEFHEVASNPEKQLEKYLSEGEKIVLTAPVYAPEEIVHSMGLVPMGAWGADTTLSRSKEYFPAFMCSVVQSILELGVGGAYKGASAIIVPSLCDSLKCLGENWKVAVKDIPFIPMTYPQNRKPEFGRDFCEASYKRVISDLERVTGRSFSFEALAKSEKIYNEHNALMRDFDELCAKHPEVSAKERSDVFKSAFFMKKEEHSLKLKELIDELKSSETSDAGIRIITSGILFDSPQLLKIFDDLGFHVVGDDIAAQSRLYRNDCVLSGDSLKALTDKFADTDNCSLLYDQEKKRVKYIIELAKERKADGIVVLLTKFCDPEEFDLPFIKKEAESAGIPMLSIEIDRQMTDFAQARTALQSFGEMIVNR